MNPKASAQLENLDSLLSELWRMSIRTGDIALSSQAQAACNALGQLTRSLEPEAPPVPAMDPAPVSGDPMSLFALTSMQELGPDMTELREHLGQALVVAERIDQARGRSSSESVGGSHGWDLAEEVNQLLATVESQSLGAVGKGME